MKLIKDLGMQYSTKSSKQRYSFGLYECPVCKKHFRTAKRSIKSGNTTKCKGCALVTHRGTKTRLYNIWSKMKNRCCNEKYIYYSSYGGRGITICDDWLKDFVIFRDWALSNGYKEEFTIDRINNDGNYEPSNCRWTTLNIQARNTKLLARNNTSGYRCVHWSKSNKKWETQITVNSKKVYLGSFDYPYTAAYVYDSYVIKHNLEHTRNFKEIK